MHFCFENELVYLQFERDKKGKGNEGTQSTIGHTIGLEEVLSSLSTSEFLDEQVTKISYFKEFSTVAKKH